MAGRYNFFFIVVLLKCCDEWENEKWENEKWLNERPLQQQFKDYLHWANLFF